MSLVFSEEQDELRRVLRSYFASHCSLQETRRLMETTDGYDPRVWKQMGDELGLQGIALPEAFGGGGFSFIDQVVIVEEMGRALVSSPYFSSVILAGTALLNSGDEAAQNDFLPQIASGQMIATLAVSENDGDWSGATCETSAIEVDGTFVLSGTKSFVLDGAVADLILVLAQTPAGPSLFAVEGEPLGLTRTPLKTLDATRKLALLEFSSVPARLIGPIGTGLSAVLPAVQTAIVALAVEQVGAANRCLEICVDYAKSRVQFGRPIGGFQAIKHKCANLLMHVESSRSAAYYAAWAIADDSDDVSLATSLAKAYCSDTFNMATADLIQILGGIGFTWEHDAHLYYRRSRSSALLFGSPERHRDIVAGILLDAVDRQDAQS